MTTDCCPICNRPALKEPDGSFSNFSVRFELQYDNNVSERDAYGGMRTLTNSSSTVTIDLDLESQQFRIKHDTMPVQEGSFTNPDTGSTEHGVFISGGVTIEKKVSTVYPYASYIQK